MNWRKPLVYLSLYATGSKIPANLREIRRVSALSIDDQKKYREDKLAKLLLHASENVPYYTRILKETGAVVDGKVFLENFSRVPILTKSVIRKEGENMFSVDRHLRKPYENTSGGSTGEPVRFLHDKNYHEWNVANKIFYKTFAGQDIGDRELRLWGSERDILLGKESLLIRLRNFLYGRVDLNSFRMSQEGMQNFVTIWNKFHPKWVEAYVQSIYEFALFIEKNNYDVSSPSSGILTSAGTLYPEMAKKIKSVFKCNVFNRYGSREVGDIACSDLSEEGLRISFWNNYVEIVNNKIYVTNLNNFSMPMIRYDIGDMGISSSSWNYIKSVEGRGMSVIKTREGKIIPGEFFIHFIGVVHNKGHISKFQVIQKDFKTIEIKVVIENHQGFEDEKRNIEMSIAQAIGGDCEIKWSLVEDIPSLENGKYMYVLSEMQ